MLAQETQACRFNDVSERVRLFLHVNRAGLVPDVSIRMEYAMIMTQVRRHASEIDLLVI